MPASKSARRFLRAANRRGLLLGASAVALLLGSVAHVDARSLGGGSGGGSPGGAAAAAAAAAAQAGAQQGSATAQQAIASMARAAQALDAMRAAQNAARAAALSGGAPVPNGLQSGGLVVAPGAGSTAGVWAGAGLPSETTASGRTQVEIKQTEAKAILNWSSFNVGRETDVYFNQTAGGADASTWIALNRVTDPSLAPSRILGSIKAEGQVYVVNKNGIVFGGASQVNVNSFVASSLSLSDEQFRAGINKQLTLMDPFGYADTAVPQFGYLGQKRPDMFIGLKDPRQLAGIVIGDAPGSVTVEAGARLTMASGGKAMLFAPHVINSGTVSAPDGQVLMAAGEQIYLSDDKFSGVRGLEVAASAPMRWLFNYYHMMMASGQDTLSAPNAFTDGLKIIVFPEMAARAASVGYQVVNNGMVRADHGNITLLGRSVTQNGGLEASTALNNRDGSIVLRAWEAGMMSYASSIPAGSPLRFWKTGTLTLGSGSVTTSMPDLSDTSEIEQSSLVTRYSPGRVEMRGTFIDIEPRANVIVPAGKISIVASTWTDAGETPITGEQVRRDGSRVYIGEQAYLSTAGIQNVLLSMESNVVQGEFRINELRDSPLYRDSWLRGLTVSVDKRVSGLFGDGPMADVQWIAGSPGKWVGTPLGDFSGWIGVGNTTLGELSTKAGSIAIKSSGSIITREGSLLDVSGGSVRYQDGWITTTKILGADGRIYDIGKATPDRLYVGLGGSFARTHNVQGKFDNRLTENWRSIFDRSTDRRFERGYTEGRAAGSIRMFAAEAVVLEGSYSGGVIDGERQVATDNLASAGTFTFGGLSDEHRAWLIGELIVASEAKLLPKDFRADSALDPFWYSGSKDDDQSFRKKVTYLDADVLAKSGMAKLDLYVGAGFTLGRNEKLELAAGTAFNVIANVGATNPATFTVDGAIRIAGGSVELVGAEHAFYGKDAIIDVSGEWFNGARTTRSPIVKGGRISVAGKFEDGVVLDVSGGGWYDTTGLKPKLKLGDAGAIAISPTDTAQLVGLDLRAYSAASGGTLAVISTGSITIGGTMPLDPGMGWLPGSLFVDRGFRGFELTTTGDIVVADGATVALRPMTIDVTGINPAAIASGARTSDLGPLITLPLAERAALKPTSLSFVGERVTIGEGAVVTTDVGGSITLAAIRPDNPRPGASSDLIIRGTIEATAGKIALSAGGELKLTSDARVLARGMAVIDHTVRGQRFGKVLSGGSVDFTTTGKMTLERGALVDVSGVSGELDLDNGRGAPERYTLSSDGGSISLSFSGAAQDLVDATFLARAGGAGASGGTININVGSEGAEDTDPYYMPFDLYYRDRNDGQIKMFGLGNLDIYREYTNGSESSFEFFEVWSKLADASMKLIRGGGVGIVDLKSSATPGVVKLPAAAVLTEMASQLDLLTRHFYTDPNATIPLARELPNALVKVTKISADAVNGGGFANLNVNSAAFMVAPGVDLSFGRSVSIGSTIASGGAGSASIAAPYIQLLVGTGIVGEAGSGKLTLKADLIDVTRATFSGFAETQLIARDLRLGGLLTDLTSSRSSFLTADGQLTLQTAQVYPATGVLASIKAGAQIDVIRNGQSDLPLSAAGSLALEAPVIVQNGVLRAPFGSITLAATDSVALGAGSITSVSGDGLILPYGTLSNNEFWADPVAKLPEDGSTPTLGKLPEKNIVLQGPKVSLATGSVVDIRGGGDLYAWEHVPGPGGSHDVLAQSGVYAIVPGMKSAGAAQQKIWLAGGNGLAAGWYDLLPARYAMLPGAFAVSMVKDSSSPRSMATTTMVDGTAIMTGYRADSYGTGYDQLRSSWCVMSGDVIRSYSEYNEASANTYFSSEAFKLSQYRLTGVNVVTPRLPMDGGSVVFKATNDLVLNGQLQSQPAAGGRGGLVDIASTKIAIVGAGQDRSDLADYLIIDSKALSDFGAGSLLIGGIRSGDKQGLRIDVTASDVVVRNDAANALSGSEILLTASDAVTIGNGSVVTAQGAAQSDSVDLVIAPHIKAVYGDPGGWDDGNPNNDVMLSPSKDYGALVRVSVGNAVRVMRENVDTTIGGLVTVEAGAVVSASNALMLDATQNTLVAGKASLSGKSMSLASGRIGFGGGTGGLVLDTASLSQFANTDALTLRSYSTIDFFSSVDLGSAGRGTVTLDAAAFVGHGNDPVVISGRSIALENSGAVFAGPAGAGHGRLHLRGDEIVLGSGNKMLSGFDTITLEGRGQIVGRGNGAMDAKQADVTLASPLITGRSGAAQSLVTQGGLHIVGGNSDRPAAEDSLGARITFTGASVDLDSRIVARGGAVNVTATGGNVVVGAGGAIDVSGFSKDFFDVTEYADAGSISLTAVGSVVLSSNGTLNLAADPVGGRAGSLTVVASGGGTVVLDGRIDATAGATGRGGSFVLDIAELPNYAALSQVLNTAGFSHSRNIRVRTGNVVVDGTTNVSEFVLSADQGAVTLAGLIDARSEYGGSISVSAGGDLDMRASAMLIAGATGSHGGGRVTLETRNGQLDIRGGTIDVAGADGGRVRLRAPQTNDPDQIKVGQIQVGIVGAKSAVLEGVHFGVVDATHSFDVVRAAMTAAAKDFADTAAAQIAARLNLPAGMVVMPGIEISSAGDLVVGSDWNLFTDFANARQGTLTLRAGGNLTVLGHISDGFSLADRSGALQAGESWNLQLVAGADLTSANALSLTPAATLSTGAGTLTIGSASDGRVVRTGTGDLDVRVGRDLVLANYQSTIYTAGRSDLVTPAGFIRPSGAVYGVGGGHLRIAVQGDASAALARAADDPQSKDRNQLFVEWLKKTGTTDGSFLYESGRQASWWIDYGAFAQGVGALGGGNVSFSAGGDLTNMLVALPNIGLVTGGLTAGETKALYTANGGLMNVNAGGAVRAGYYYVGGGAGEIVAGEFVNGRTVAVTTAGRTNSYTIAPVIALGDAAIKVRTAGDLRLQTVLDPLMLNGDSTWFDGGSGIHSAYMSGYTDRTSLDLTSTGGNITLVGQGRYLSKGIVSELDTNYSMIGRLATNLYPSQLRISALNGSVTSLGRLFTMPGSRPELRIVADQNVSLSETIMSRANPAMLPSVFYPVSGGGAAPVQYFDGVTISEGGDYQSPRSSGFHEALRNDLSDFINYTLGALNGLIMSQRNPDRLINAGDIEPSRIFAKNGTISSSLFISEGAPRISWLVANEQLWLRAGTDIRNIDYNLFNVNRTDVSILDAGKDIIGGSVRIRGPGAVLVTAGRDVYGSDFTIFSHGAYDRYMPNNRVEEASRIRGLPNDGAAITVMAGLQGRQPSYDAFAENYLNPANMGSMPDHLKATTIPGELMPLYLATVVDIRDGKVMVLRKGLIDFVYEMTGERLGMNDAWARFQSLPVVTQQRFIREAYMQELRESGDNQLTRDVDGRPLNGGYKRGYTAINTLFPGDGWKGDIKLGYGTFRTMAGGNIETLTPGGGLQVAALGAVVPAGAGLVTLGYGDINVFARDSVTVNRSRVLTFAGGDVTIWSTLGDIDAGRGAKTVRVPSAPEIETDVEGNTKVRERADIGGSGIGTIIGFTGVEPGDVSLIAPEGTVDAGDAGIRVSGNFVVAALQVLNAENIKVDGDKKGLPKVENVSVSLSVQTKDKAADDATKEATQAGGNERPSVIIVEVLGYGGAGAADQATEKQSEEEEKKRREQQQRERRSDNYDRTSPVQVLGAGELTDLQTEALIYQKRQWVQ